MNSLSDALSAMAVHLSLDVACVVVLVWLVYVRIDPRRDFVLTYVLLNLITFALCFLLGQVPMELGFALGLFAVFGILRYRTEAIRLRDLTYLFVVLALGILNAMGGPLHLAELAVLDALIVTAAILVDRPFARQRGIERKVVYDKLDLLAPDREAALLGDLRGRVHIEVQRVTVESIDLIKQTAVLTIHGIRTR